MKKVVLIITVFWLLFSLCACSSLDKNSELSGSDTQGAITDSQNTNEYSQNTKGLNLLVDDSTSEVSNHFGTEKGFYYLTEDMHLMYIDYNTQKEVYLCTDSSCRHDNEDCTALFSDFGTDSVLFVWGDYLYFLNRDYDDDGAMSIFIGETSPEAQGSADTLYRMKLDGTDRTKVFTFPDKQTTEKFVMGDGDSLWFITKELKNTTEDGTTLTSSSNRQLVKYSISKNEIVDTLSLALDDDTFYKPVGCTDSKVVLYKIAYPDGMSEEDASKLSDEEWLKATRNSNIQYVALDLNTEKITELYSFKNTGLRSTGFVSDGYVYLSDCSSGTIMKINVDTAEAKVLCNTTKNYIYMVTNDVLCCMDSSSDVADNNYYFIDKETGEIKTSTLTIKNIGWSLELRAAASDKFLVVNEYDAKELGDGGYEIYGKKFALIAKEDMYNSRANYLPIEMVGDGQ